MTIHNRNSYFAAANSRGGFISFFDDIFSKNELERLYIIKGGSGTGKSRLMRDIAESAESIGEQVEYFYCSSDPSSLDGVILTDRRIGIIDGTPPHTAEPKLPGCFDFIINLGVFWDASRLVDKKREIKALCAQKSELYKRAYSYLSVAGDITELYDDMIKPYIKTEKLDGWANRFCRRFESTGEYRVRIRLSCGISALGKTRLDGVYDRAKTRYLISDTPHMSHLVLKAVHEKLKEKRVSHTVSYDPLDTRKLDAVYIDDADVSFIPICEGRECLADDFIINAERFFDKNAFRSERVSARQALRCASLMTDAASSTMKKIYALHTSLESVYIQSMDFKAKEEYTKVLISEILG
ncbi:MAG: hypothetical protein J6V93_02510 [Clostridia bacterium]|nr:hypothetical protein [Clostridia bacterium]